MKQTNAKSKLRKVYVILGLCISLYMYFRSGITYLPIENLYIPSVIAIDVNDYSKNDVKYVSGISAYIFSESGTTKSTFQVGESKTFPETREDRQTHSDHKLIFGLEREVVFLSNFAKFGINPFISATFANPNINDTSTCCVLDGKMQDFEKIQLEGYASIGDFLEGLLNRSTDYNFFSDNYKLMDIYVRLDAEGRNIVLPYITFIKNEPTIIGMALFNKDKMVRTLDMHDTKIMNLLRENKVHGILTLKNNSRESIDYYALSKRKVKCTKTDDKYHFLIELNLSGDITSNSFMPNISYNKNLRNKFQEQLVKEVENNCNEFIRKMQKEYKVDCLELGRYAAAKYGRRTGVDWNKVVCDDSEIEVKINAKITTTGRGEY